MASYEAERAMLSLEGVRWTGDESWSTRTRLETTIDRGDVRVVLTCEYRDAPNPQENGWRCTARKLWRDAGAVGGWMKDEPRSNISHGGSMTAAKQLVLDLAAYLLAG